MIEARSSKRLTSAVVGSQRQFRGKPESNRLLDAIEMLLVERE